MRASVELVNDSAFDLESLIAGAAGVRFARGVGAAFVATLLSSAGAGVTTASTTAITGPELIKLTGAINEAYLPNASFLMKRSTYVTLLQLVGSSGNFLFPAAFNAEGRPTLLGFPVYFSPSMGAMTAGLQPVTFGDHRKFVRRQVRDSLGLRVYVELFALYAQVGYPSAAQFLIDTFGKSPNIEDLITTLQSRIDALNTPEGKAERMRLGNCRGRLTSCLREWFREIHTKPACAYAEFASKVIQPGDVVITFNYDDSLERELSRAGVWDVSRGYGFPLGAEDTHSKTLLLKLHGSMNWLISVFGGARAGAFQVGGWPPFAFGDAPVIHPADLHHLGYADFKGRVFTGGCALECLILPGRKKEFFYDTSFGREFGDFWELLWSQAAEAVNRSERIVLCGYSLLPVDQRARELLLRMPKRQTHVTVVCGSQSERIAGDFRAAGLQHVRVFAGGYFEDWVKAAVNESLRP